jgi:hypothetical protein
LGVSKCSPKQDLALDLEMSLLKITSFDNYFSESNNTKPQAMFQAGCLPTCLSQR